ncbi:hypothetical protein PV327_005033 [Microctonus hyperodae]|uniref:HAT C-terminal dimerisation domain-containing protein n=1 Tax=Microctonus hyperodae TaxID=165561 RepID=A0AA39G0S9_MICHY|nr:hypothetical protein PV327_005033 [Microctonus hyperodae]
MTKNFLNIQEISQNIENIDFRNPNNHRAINDVILGAECGSYLNGLEEIGHQNVKFIREKCLKFYITAAIEIRNRFPFESDFLKKLNVFRPRTALYNHHRETSFRDISYIASQLNGFDERQIKIQWGHLYNDFSFEQKIRHSKSNFDEMWKKILKSFSPRRFPQLQSLTNAVRSLPHSNADPGRAFSVLTDLKTKKR